MLNFCHDGLVADDEVGLSESAFRDLGLAEGTLVTAALAAPPESVRRVRSKLGGERLERADFDAILKDVASHRYSKVELSMFVLACALRHLDTAELDRLHPGDDRHRTAARVRLRTWWPTSTASAASRETAPP